MSKSDVVENRIRDQYPFIPNVTHDEDFAFDEFVSAIPKIKHKKACGVGGILADHLKYGGRPLICAIT